MTVTSDAEPPAAPVATARRSEALRFRALSLQGTVIVAIGLVLFYLGHNLVLNMDRLNVHTGFAFLARPAGNTKEDAISASAFWLQTRSCARGSNMPSIQ